MLVSSVWRGSSLRWFNCGLLLGGSFTATGLILLSALLIHPWWPGSATVPTIGAASLVLLLHELGVIRVWLPQNARLVPQSVVDAGPRIGALQFGFEMGTGSRTYVTSALPYLCVLVLLIVTGPAESVVSGMSFGVGRALMTTSRDWSRDVHVWDGLLLLHDRSLRIVCFLLGVIATASIVYL